MYALLTDKMNKTQLKKRVKSLQSLPPKIKGKKDMSFIDAYPDDKIHDICEACYNIVHMKLPMDSKKRNQLKKKLLPIHEDIRNLAKPHTAVSTKRKILKKPQVGAGIFTALASIVVPTILSMLGSK